MEYPLYSPHRARKPQLEQSLRLCPVFADWPDHSLHELAAVAQARRYRRRTPLGLRSARGQEVLVVVSGALEMATTNTDGSKYILAVLGAGQVTGLMYLLEEAPILFSIHAYEDVELIHIPCAAMRRILDAQPPLWRSVARIALQRYHLALETRRDWALGSVRRRMALVLINLAHRYGDLSSRAGVSGTDLRVTQADLASMLGVSRQTVAKELGRLKADGVLDSHAGYRVVTLRDMPALLRIADEP